MTDYAAIGQRLRAHRLGAALSPEHIAEQLGISRAALYNYEKGATPVRVETLERIAVLLDVSLPSLLGAGTEYFSSAVAYFERMRQIEADAEQVISQFEPVSYLLVSDAYPALLRTMLIEALPASLPDPDTAHADIDRLMDVLAERRRAMQARQVPLASLIGATQIQRFLRTGLIGTYRLSAAELAHRRELARAEVARLVELMEDEPVGVQIGVVEDSLPHQTFEICRRRDGAAMVAVSPFRLGELPNVRLGVASVSGAPDAVAMHERAAAHMWRQALKGGRGAALLRGFLTENRAT